MLTPTDILIHSLTASRELVHRFVADLSPAEYLYRPTEKSNCVAWLLGHLTLSDRRVMGLILGIADLPQLPDGFEKRFGRDEGSPQSAEFGDVSPLLPLFLETRDLLISHVRSLDPALLNQPIPMSHPRFKIIFEAINFMGIHASMHAGQITIIRRGLGRPPLF